MELSLVVEEKSTRSFFFVFALSAPSGIWNLVRTVSWIEPVLCSSKFLGVGETSWRVVDVHEFSATSLDNV